MSKQILYSDSLVEITPDSILLRGFYFPFGSKRILFTDIAGVEVERPTFWKGKYRLYGSGDFRTWFPPDWRRPSRDRLFLMNLKGRQCRVGFTVEDSTAVEKILRERGVLTDAACVA